MTTQQRVSILSYSALNQIRLHPSFSKQHWTPYSGNSILRPLNIVDLWPQVVISSGQDLLLWLRQGNTTAGSQATNPLTVTHSMFRTCFGAVMEDTTETTNFKEASSPPNNLTDAKPFNDAHFWTNRLALVNLTTVLTIIPGPKHPLLRHPCLHWLHVHTLGEVQSVRGREERVKVAYTLTEFSW